MKIKGIYVGLCLFTGMIFNACKTVDTNLSIQKKPLPPSFYNDSDSSEISKINWRSYFNDPILSGLIDTALVNNHDLNIAIQKIEIARASVTNAKASLIPQVNAGTNGGIRRFGRYTMDGAGNIATEMTPGRIVPINLPDIFLGFQASWEIDLWKKLKSKQKSAINQFLASAEGAKVVTASLVSDIATSYYELLALDHELEIIQQTIQRQKDALEIIKLKKETGRTNELAVQQFQAQLLNTQAIEKELLQQIVEFENRINFLLGRFPQKVERFKEILLADVPSQIKTGLPSQLLENRPDIREAELLLEASKFDLKSAKAAFLPSMNLVAGLGFQAFKPEFLFLAPASITYQALGGLMTPLINRNALKANFSYAKANQLSAMHHYQKSILTGYTEVMNQLSALENLKNLHVLKKEENSVLNNSVDMSTELFSTGRASYLEVLLAQQNSLQAKFELINVNKRQHIAAVNLYKALGGGW
ncbi:TolC family protein [Pedobacter puniceum]|uniref:TolC family protein n=1 Tax=Pedobacter puniceum TaxID=2666136 RepID=UPI0018A1DFD7|nr:TolC family protein [Pedobacter puniceum]